MPPDRIKNILRGLYRTLKPASRARREANSWLRKQCPAIHGNVLSIGSGNDSDGCGAHYRDYFINASSYTTSEVTAGFGCDLVLDVRCLPEIKDQAYDCVFCSGVLEHVDDFQSALKEIGRILKTGGILLLGVPFKQALHMPPHDYWRFTEYGLKTLLAKNYDITALDPIPAGNRSFPSAYWCCACKLK